MSRLVEIRNDFDRDFEGLINGAFLDLQDFHDIKSGDIRPEDAFKLDELKDEIYSLILKVIEYEK